MSRIVPKLNLNKTPQLVENNSLVMAKNIRLLEDGTIGPDTSLENIHTETGTGTSITIEHPAKTATIVNVAYSILNPERAITYIRDEETIDSEDLEEDSYDFKNDVPNREVYANTDVTKIYNIDSKQVCNIFCKKYNDTFYWVKEKFTLDINDNILKDSNGLCLFLAVRNDIYNNEVIAGVTAPEYVYIAIPKSYLNSTILYSKQSTNPINYKVINPLVTTSSTETITIQEAYTETIESYDARQYIGQIVGLNNKIYFFMESNLVVYSTAIKALIETKYPEESFDSNRSGATQTFGVDENGFVTRNGILYEDLDIARASVTNKNDRIRIYKYDEDTKVLTVVPSAWKYSGGKINGCVSVNNTGEQILTIAEYDIPGDALVPLKHINLSHCRFRDDESIYTQAPNIPITNLLFERKYTCSIPSGTYQFFIRYEIKDEFYTNWFPCSTELFAATNKKLDTAQGSIKYIDLHEDASESFVFNIQHLFPAYCDNFEGYQLGFILAHDDGVFARSWKSFKFNPNSEVDEIFFDYDNSFIKEINIDDMLKVNYDLYNVNNIANFKNKLYISNFIETDFNKNSRPLIDFAKHINIELKSKVIEGKTTYTYNGYAAVSHPTVSGMYTHFALNGDLKSFKTVYANNVYATIKETLGNETHYGYSAGHGLNYNYLFIAKFAVIDNNTETQLITDKSAYVYDNNDNFDYAAANFINIPCTFSYSDYVSKVESYCYDFIKNNFAYVDSDMNFYILHNGNILKANKFKFICRAYITNNDANSRDDYVREVIVDVKSHYKIEQKLLSISEAQTLLPFTNYDFYCHFIKQNGIVTNGYHIDSCYIKRWGNINPNLSVGQTIVEKTSDHEIMTGDSDSGTYSYSEGGTTSGPVSADAIEYASNVIVYPTFTPQDAELPDGYVGYFITMYKHKNEVCEVFNHVGVPSGNATEEWFDCLECDTRLFKPYKNLKIVNYKKTVLTNYGRYFASGETGDDLTDLTYFGDVGIVKSPTPIPGKDVRHWIIGNEFVNGDDKSLVKVTPYISGVSAYDIDDNLNLQGYFCNVSKLKNQEKLGERLYINGSDIYILSISNNETTIELKDIQQGIAKTDNNVIISNYNLNYLSLTQDLNSKIRSYEDSNNDQKNQILYTVDSLIASNILTLEKAFKDYTRKLYYVVDDTKITKFNNTIRASNIDSTELYRYIYRFDAEDYYMCPSHRGIITNLISIANSLYVHCEHSLFKFTDNRTLDSDNNAVTLKENNIFDSGISEVFDAQYGYAGLKDREHSLVTFNAYIFYDATSKNIYGFEGQNQIGNISNSIKKLIDYVNPTDVKFVADENHNRFFVNLINNYGNVCLSFNFAAKSFISIHDMNFEFGFHTRSNTYFIHKNIYNNSEIGWSIYKIVDYLTYNYNKYFSAYQNCYANSLVFLNDCEDASVKDFCCVDSCIDIININSYEIIKNLESINWICSEISNYIGDSFYCAEESLNEEYPGNKIRIYTDRTSTELLNLLDPNLNPLIANKEKLINNNGQANPNTWQYIRYNCGIWSMNYFRDIKNKYDVFNYKAAKNGITGDATHFPDTNLHAYTQRQNYTQESSLLYGKYFVVRFIFNNKNFKLENLTLKLSDYGKTK